jgi:ketosteroid isomerase-like protein
MSQENVEVVRRGIEAFNADDWDLALSFYDTEAEWHPYMAALESRIYKGRTSIRRMWEEMRAQFPDFAVEAEELQDFGDCVVVGLVARGTGRASGIESLTKFTQVWTVSKGKIVRVEGFQQRSEALAAAGLSEQDTQAET